MKGLFAFVLVVLVAAFGGCRDKAAEKQGGAGKNVTPPNQQTTPPANNAESTEKEFDGFDSSKGGSGSTQVGGDTK